MQSDVHLLLDILVIRCRTSMLFKLKLSVLCEHATLHPSVLAPSAFRLHVLFAIFPVADTRSRSDTFIEDHRSGVLHRNVPHLESIVLILHTV